MTTEADDGEPSFPYADLVEAMERSQLVADGPAHAKGVATFEDLRHVFVVELAPWNSMLEQLLNQLADDAGSIGRALSLLGVPTYELIDAWTRGATAGMQASVGWLAGRPQDSTPDIRLRTIKIKRGEDYSDLSESVRNFRLRGDGELDPARLRPSYTIELRRLWLSMVGDLLGQVVADAGSSARAAVVLGVSHRRFAQWVRWFVSRGSARAARSDWPLASNEEIDGVRPYADLADAVLRGAMSEFADDEPIVLSLNELQEFYRVKLGQWDDMVGDLLVQISLDAGSLRKAAKVIGMPRSTFSTKMRRYRERRARLRS